MRDLDSIIDAVLVEQGFRRPVARRQRWSSNVIQAARIADIGAASKGARRRIARGAE